MSVSLSFSHLIFFSSYLILVILIFVVDMKQKMKPFFKNVCSSLFDHEKENCLSSQNTQSNIMFKHTPKLIK